MSTPRVSVHPDTGIPDLVRNLTDDSKRLVSDEVRLAKLELKESVKRAGKGTMWLALAFGIGVVAMVAFTIGLAALIGRVVNHNYWVGALVTGALELAAAVWLFKQGASAFGHASYTLPATRGTLKDTADWVSNARGANGRVAAGVRS